MCWVRGVGLEAARRFPAVDARQGEVHQDDVGRERARQFNRLSAVGSFGDSEAADQQRLRVHFTGVVVVIDDEHERFHGGGHRRPKYAGGYVMVKHSCQ